MKDLSTILISHKLFHWIDKYKWLFYVTSEWVSGSLPKPLKCEKVYLDWCIIYFFSSTKGHWAPWKAFKVFLCMTEQILGW